MSTPRQPFLTRIAAGDAAAVAACIDEYGGMVYSLADRYLRSSSGAGAGEVDDAMQEIFIEVWRCAGRYDPARGSEASYIATIAHRRLIDRRQRLGAGPRMTRPEGDLADTRRLPSSHMPDDFRVAMDAVNRLETPEREVLQLSLQNGLSHSSIAAAIGVPIGTVKTRIRRGLMRVRELLSGKGAAAVAPAQRGGAA